MHPVRSMAGFAESEAGFAGASSTGFAEGEYLKPAGDLVRTDADPRGADAPPCAAISYSRRSVADQLQPYGHRYIGGKALGMLPSRAILRSDHDRGWGELLERHDSFHVGSDLFHSFIEHNGWLNIFRESGARRAPFQRRTAELTAPSRGVSARFPVGVRANAGLLLPLFDIVRQGVVCCMKGADFEDCDE